IEAILHTIYPFAIECIIRLASLSSYEEKRRHRSVAYLASVGSRLRLMTDIFRLDSISTSSREFERILELSEVVLELIEQEIQKCPPHIRRVHREEGRRVLKRYIWDIGQLLCRGVSVKDPHLRDVEYSEGRAKFNFRGKRYTASLRP